MKIFKIISIILVIIGAIGAIISFIRLISTNELHWVFITSLIVLIIGLSFLLAINDKTFK